MYYIKTNTDRSNIAQNRKKNKSKLMNFTRVRNVQNAPYVSLILYQMYSLKTFFYQGRKEKKMK